MQDELGEQYRHRILAGIRSVFGRASLAVNGILISGDGSDHNSITNISVTGCSPLVSGCKSARCPLPQHVA